MPPVASVSTRSKCQKPSKSPLSLVSISQEARATRTNAANIVLNNRFAVICCGVEMLRW